MKFTSILITHFASSPDRSKFLRMSLESLKGTVHTPYELIVADNGGSMEDSEYLLKLTEEGFINTYLRNANNMHFAFARNQMLKICNGDYIAVCDNDIFYNDNWLDMCLAVLDEHPKEKLWATPIYNVAHWRPKYWNGTITARGQEYRLNRRAGSNCWVMRREHFEKMGGFLIHRVAGSKWTDRAARRGYWGAVTPQVMVNDHGFRRGYDLNDAIPVKIDLHYAVAYFNEDEFVGKNPDEIFIKQRSFK